MVVYEVTVRFEATSDEHACDMAESIDDMLDPWVEPGTTTRPGVASQPRRILDEGGKRHE